MAASYAIGDIHGCNRTLNALLQRLALRGGDTVVFLGDYIDRGPDSKGVMDTVFRLREEGIRTVCLRGNHEQMLLDSLPSPADLYNWTRNGGDKVLANFGVKHPTEIPEKYLQFFQDTLLHAVVGDYIFVHGGPDWNTPDEILTNPQVVMWARWWYDKIDYDWLGKRYILHGHTPEKLDTILQQVQALDTQRYLNLDNGCVYAGRRPGLGNLLAFCLETKELYKQVNLESDHYY
jgi:serine/threonine protein phosphatase 1